MKCIETDCNAFYVDPSSKKCILGSLKEPCLASQLPNDGITVYRNKELQKLHCLDCLIENGFYYTSPYGHLGCTSDATDEASCWSFCKAKYHLGVTYPVVKYFTFSSALNKCCCQGGSNTIKEALSDPVSGEVICAGKLPNKNRATSNMATTTVIIMQI